jgi:cell division protein FtsA
VPGRGGREPLALPQGNIFEIIESRMREIFTQIQRELNMPVDDGLPTAARGGTADIPPLSRIVLTGGGANLTGCAELAQYVFNLPVRVGAPRISGGVIDEYKTPDFATAVGLVLESDARARPPAVERFDVGGGTAGGRKKEGWFKRLLEEFF